MNRSEAYQYPRPISVATYLEDERHAEHKHEYFDGEVYAMAGVSGRS